MSVKVQPLSYCTIWTLVQDIQLLQCCEDLCTDTQSFIDTRVLLAHVCNTTLLFEACDTSLLLFVYSFIFLCCHLPGHFSWMMIYLQIFQHLQYPPVLCPTWIAICQRCDCRIECSMRGINGCYEESTYVVCTI